MEPTAPKPQDIVDTTDSLEAVGACRSMTNLMFCLILLGLLVPQLIFWLDRINLIEDSSCGCSSIQITSTLSVPMLPMLTAEVPPAQAAEEKTEPAEQKNNVTVSEKDAEPQAAGTEEAAEATPPAEPKEPFRIPCRLACTIVSICNFLVLVGAALYCLCLLMCLKISLTGRLGGVNHVTRAFFVSLLLLVLLIPWQRLLPGVLVGVVWTPGELLCGGWVKAGESTFWKVLFYLRFIGLWFVAMWLLVWAQIRSAKWQHATLRRLGIVR